MKTLITRSAPSFGKAFAVSPLGTAGAVWWRGGGRPRWIGAEFIPCPGSADTQRSTTKGLVVYGSLRKGRVAKYSCAPAHAFLRVNGAMELANARISRPKLIGEAKLP